MHCWLGDHESDAFGTNLSPTKHQTPTAIHPIGTRPRNFVSHPQSRHLQCRGHRPRHQSIVLSFSTVSAAVSRLMSATSCSVQGTTYFVFCCLNQTSTQCVRVIVASTFQLTIKTSTSGHANEWAFTERMILINQMQLTTEITYLHLDSCGTDGH